MPNILSLSLKKKKNGIQIQNSTPQFYYCLFTMRDLHWLIAMLYHINWKVTAMKLTVTRLICQWNQTLRNSTLLPCNTYLYLSTDLLKFVAPLTEFANLSLFHNVRKNPSHFPHWRNSKHCHAKLGTTKQFTITKPKSHQVFAT